MKHELLLTSDAVTYFSKQGLTSQQVLSDMEQVADLICKKKGWKVGINAMVVIRETSLHRRDVENPWFVINQVLDTHKSAISSRDLNCNTPSLNSDAHCILTTKGNGPNRYGGYTRMLSGAKKGTLSNRIV